MADEKDAPIEETHAEEPLVEGSSETEPKVPVLGKVLIEVVTPEKVPETTSEKEKPKEETPKAPETPKEETPKVETPKVETPKVETPKVETPKVETPAPVSETPKEETPKVETPKVETPAPETPKEEPKKPTIDEIIDALKKDEKLRKEFFARAFKEMQRPS